MQRACCAISARLSNRLARHGLKVKGMWQCNWLRCLDQHCLRRMYMSCVHESVVMRRWDNIVCVLL